MSLSGRCPDGCKFGSGSRLSALKAVLELAIAGPRKEDIAAAKALLKRYETEFALARHDLKDAFLYAPIDGIVQDRILEFGLLRFREIHSLRHKHASSLQYSILSVP